jgi:hypothetical protein
MESLALGAFIGHNIVGIDADRSIALAGIQYRAIQQGKSAFYAGTICDRPLYSTFIDSVIGAFWFTGPAIDTFFRYFNSHILKIRG